MATFGGIVIATGSESEGRRTLLDVINELSRPVDASDTTIRALAADAFRAAVRRMNRKGCWPWEHQEEDVSITANAVYSTVTSAIKKPLAMHLLDASGGTRDQKLAYVDYETFIDKFNLDISSDPHTYTIPNLFETGQIRWFPTPSSNDNARFTFYRVTPVPRNEQETIEIPDLATEAYMAVAWYEFLKRLPSQQRPYSISIAKVDAQEAFREISAHVRAPGDRSREVVGWGYWGG